ncbi:MAG: chemotaxis protein CheW, partial [Candidatus Methanomethylicaceae archaeon]
VMNLREKVLPLVSSRRIFNLEEKPLDEADRIIVLNLRDLSVGLVVDTVKEVLRVPESVIERLPSILSHGRENYEISEVCKLDHGKRLVSVICVSNLLPHKEVTEVMREMSRCNPDQSLTNEEETEDEEQVVVFLLDGGEYAVSIRRVQEIVRVPEELTKVPKTPPFVEGVINLRGTVLPVIDLRKRLDVSLRERDESERIVVLTIGEISVGFIVDTVAEVLKIPRNLIQEAPHLSHEQVKLLGRIANLEKEGRMIQLIDPDTLLGEQEVQTLAQEAA